MSTIAKNRPFLLYKVLTLHYVHTWGLSWVRNHIRTLCNLACLQDRMDRLTILQMGRLTILQMGRLKKIMA